MAQTKPPLSTLVIPLWFVVIVSWLLCFRVYAKLTQATAPAGQGIAWVSPEQCEEMIKDPQYKGKQLILYEFTASWCPPCKKRERTDFRAPDVISEINGNFLPVKVDLSNKTLCDKPATKALIDKFTVGSIPLCVVTLKSGEKVDDDQYRFNDKFIEFVSRAKKRAVLARAKLSLASGDYQTALSNLSPKLLSGDEIVDAYDTVNYLMCHHLLLVLKRDSEVEPMMQKAYATTQKYYESYRGDKKVLDWLRNLNSYLRNQMSEADLIKSATCDRDRASFYLAIGLKDLRAGDKARAIKALHHASVLSSKSYRTDGLSEPLVQELEK